jgi:hypothetical protein
MDGYLMVKVKSGSDGWKWIGVEMMDGKWASGAACYSLVIHHYVN